MSVTLGEKTKETTTELNPSNMHCISIDAESNLEEVAQPPFSVIWLTDSIKREVEIETFLYRIFGYVKPFEDVCACISYIHIDTKIDKFYFVVSHPLKVNIVNIIHNHPNIQHVFVQCENENDQWAEAIRSKISGFFKDIIQLADLLQQNMNSFGSSDFSDNEQITNQESVGISPIKIFSKESLRTSIMNLSPESVAFVWFQLFIEILIRLPCSEHAKRDLVEMCRKYHASDNTQLKDINEFEKNYTADQAITWYTKPSFLFKLLNKAFGTQDIDYIYLFRLIIADLHKQLLSLGFDDDIESVYRGKIIPSSQLQNFKDNVNGLVAMNWFMSTTKNKQVANIYSGGDNRYDGHKPVIFKFNINRNIPRKPYAYIEDLSSIPGEEEVLFSVGSVWRIISVEELKDGYWCVELCNSEDENQRSIDLKNYLRTQIGETANVLTLANFLYERGDFDKAEYYCRKILDENVISTNVERVSAYNLLGFVRLEKNDIPVAKVYFNVARHLLETTYSSNVEELITVEISQQMATNSKWTYPPHILKALSDALRVTTQFFSPTNSTLPAIYNSIALLDYKMRNFQSAIQYFKHALQILNQTEVRYPKDMSILYNNLGSVYYECKEYQQAVDFYQKAITTGLEIFVPNHSRITDYKNNLAHAIERYNNSSKKNKN